MKYQYVMADSPRANQAGGAEEAAALRGRALHREQHRADQLPARREALERAEHQQRDRGEPARLGSGRTVVSETEAPNVLAIPV